MMNSLLARRGPERRAGRSESWLASVAILGISLGLVGCQDAEPIRTYTIPKENVSPPAGRVATAKGSENAEPTDRMLAAVLPIGDQAWFFKVTGSNADIERQEKAIEAFFAGITIGADDNKPAWKVPEGWTERPGSGMRAATLMVPGEKSPMELSVIVLPWRGSDDELLSNINRWRGQMELADATESDLPEFTHEVKVGDSTMTVVDLHGTFSSGSMVAPFAGQGAVNRPPAPPQGEPDSTASENLPEGHPPVEKPQPQQSAALDFTPPEGWQSLPAEGMRKAAFSLVDGDMRALITVISFPAQAGPMISDPLQNVNRWRREVGLAEIDEAALKEGTERIEIDGNQGTYVEIVPDGSVESESQADLATAAAMVTVGDQIWFFKLTGSRDLVARELTNFKTFLNSVAFTAS